MFYTNQPIRLHAKCTCILEMIQKSNNRIERFKSDLLLYDSTKDIFAPIRLMNTRDYFTDHIEMYENISTRLVNYYTNTMASIVERAILRSEKILQTI